MREFRIKITHIRDWRACGLHLLLSPGLGFSQNHLGGTQSILLPSLPNSIVSSAFSGPGKVGAGFPSFLRHGFLLLYLSGAKDLNLYLELNSNAHSLSKPKVI